MTKTFALRKQIWVVVCYRIVTHHQAVSTPCYLHLLHRFRVARRFDPSADCFLLENYAHRYPKAAQRSRPNHGLGRPENDVASGIVEVWED
jgi:hypothetical protein